MKQILSIFLIACTIVLFQNCSNNKNEKNLKNNRVTWFSIPSDSLERTIKFYTQVFGWKTEPLTKEKDSDFDYYTVLNSESDENYISKEPGAINGCVVKRKIGLPTPAVLVEVDDLDTAIENVKNAGGEIVTGKITMESLNAVIVLIKDTDGNFVEIFQPIKG